MKKREAEKVRGKTVIELVSPVMMVYRVGRISSSIRLRVFRWDHVNHTRQMWGS